MSSCPKEKLELFDIELGIFIILGIVIGHNIKNEKIGEKQRERYKKEWRATVISIYISVISFMLFLSISAISIIFKFKESIINYIAGFFGIASAFLAVFQYLPQIVKTYRDKAPGAVSILTLLIQVPGALVMGICLIIQPGTDWTSSSSYFVSFLLNGTVLVLCIYYTFKIKRMNKQNKSETSSKEKAEEEQFLEKGCHRVEKNK
ncbi:hypothetical protein PIROE2DRAFT_9459 [Piromyces sp. E2]|nr:hypothetical protein PIROE2DRAFT_9459 [Piromyces sp. E2]|eukprot:OUM63928.1 hypothetical protein PIROE2DRAFT_9459 [Piromyces sp. E2]